MSRLVFDEYAQRYALVFPHACWVVDGTLRFHIQGSTVGVEVDGDGHRLWMNLSVDSRRGKNGAVIYLRALLNVPEDVDAFDRGPICWPVHDRATLVDDRQSLELVGGESYLSEERRNDPSCAPLQDGDKLRLVLEQHAIQGTWTTNPRGGPSLVCCLDGGYDSSCSLTLPAGAQLLREWS